jgi:hypothetical protein
MPVAFKDAIPSRFDGPPRVICAGYQLTDGKLLGPMDMFADVAFDEARKEANRVANYMRRHGPFEPHRLGLHEMEYTTLPGYGLSLKIGRPSAATWKAAQPAYPISGNWVVDTGLKTWTPSRDGPEAALWGNRLGRQDRALRWQTLYYLVLI